LQVLPVFEVCAAGGITFTHVSVFLKPSEEFTGPVHETIYRGQVFA
jgi:hypothetical protein